MNRQYPNQRAHLRAIAIAVMRQRGLSPEFPPDALAQAASAVPAASGTLRDLRALLWCSIDNDDSRDLDQLTVAESLSDGAVKVLVAIADVDAVASRDTPIDRHAAINTTSVYTPAVIFPMLPERLSTDVTSLVADQDRGSVVIEFIVSKDGEITGSDLYRASVRNRAKLAYDSVGAWLAGNGPLPGPAADVSGMDAQLKLQDQVAQLLSKQRHEQGALDFESLELRPEFDGDALRDLHTEVRNRAKELIENLMIAGNGVTARFLDAHGFPSVRRVVRSPERWDRIVALAAVTGDVLPAFADVRALAAYLAARRAAAPDRFADLSLTVIKLLGRGEYVVDPPGGDAPGHFGLAVKDYTHSTAPNRRYPDLLTQRLVKSALAGQSCPYSVPELQQLAAHCTQQEDAANKVERQVKKSAAAMVVETRIGETFDALVTGASDKGTFVRLVTPPIEGKMVSGERGLDVGDHLRVRLASVDVDRGFIDFERA
jgi:VacB/RNase II family 3'-5' exoribonuclease